MPPGPRDRGGPARGRGRFARPRSAPADPDSADAARARAIALLARRDHPRRALKRRLADSGFAETAAESAVAALEDERLVDDARYVEATVASRRGRGHGPLRIALELRREGVSADLVAAAVDPRAPHWAEAAAEQRRRRFGALPPAGAAERARQARFLLARGFSGDQVRAALGASADADLELDGAELAAGEDGDGGE